MNDVFLTPIEIEISLLVARKRYLESRKMGLVEKTYLENSSEVDQIGAAGEMAVAKHLGMYWYAGVNTFHGPDIEPNIQVRTVKNPNHRLIIRPADNKEDIYFLVLNQSPRFTILGWIYGKMVCVDKFWMSPNGGPGAWFIPQSELRQYAYKPR